jgi:hypothetical protein
METTSHEVRAAGRGQIITNLESLENKPLKDTEQTIDTI